MHDDAELVLAVVANTTYLIEAWLQFTTGASTTQTPKTTSPSRRPQPSNSPSWPYRRSHHDNRDAVRRLGARDYAETAITRGIIASNTGTIHVRGVLITGANAGNLQLQWAQGTTTGGTPTVRKAGAFSVRRD